MDDKEREALEAEYFEASNYRDKCQLALIKVLKQAESAQRNLDTASHVVNELFVKLGGKPPGFAQVTISGDAGRTWFPVHSPGSKYGDKY